MTQARTQGRGNDPIGVRTPSSDVPASASLPDVTVRAFLAAHAAVRAKILDRLLGSVGTLACAVLGGGVFLRLVSRMSSTSVDDVARISATQIMELVQYLEQSNPGALQQALLALLQDPSVLTAMGVSFASAAMHLLGRANARRQDARS